jgi:hypothetical protein
MKKIISFSLYGADKKYSVGMICNAEIAKTIFPDWICRIYYSDSVEKYSIDELKKYDNVELVKKIEDADKSSMMWRFLPIDEEDVEVMISRDADSRLSWREKKCVDIFMKSDKLLHSIRDEVNHDKIMGGMWGIKKNNRVKMSNLIKSWEGGSNYGSDQNFVRYVVEPKFSDSYMIHCSKYLNTFPKMEKNNFFVGQVFPEDNYGKPINHIFY